MTTSFFLPPPILSTCSGTHRKQQQQQPTCQDSSILCLAEFSSGYTFRQFIEFSKRVTKDLPFAFSRKGISTAFCSSYRQVTVNAVFRREDLTKFYINTRGVNIQQSNDDNDEWYHLVNIDASELFDQVKNISKKDGIRLVQYFNDNKLHIQIFSTTSSERLLSTKGTVQIRAYTPVSYTIMEHNRRHLTCPNVTIQLSNFSACLSGLVRARLGSISIRVMDKGIIVFGVTPTGAESNTIFGTGKDDDGYIFPLTYQSIVVLIKLSNLNSEGVARLYCSGPKVLRIEISIGCYGAVRIYVSDSSTVPLTTKVKSSSSCTNISSSSVQSNSSVTSIDTRV